MADSSQEKTEEASPRQLEKARERGEVWQSKDLTASLVLAMAALTLSSLLEQGGSDFSAMTAAICQMGQTPGLSSGQLLSTFGSFAARAAVDLLPLLAVVLAVGAFIPFLQVGPLLVLEPMQPKIEKFNPAQGLKRMFGSMSSYVELGKSALKLGVVAAIFWQVISSEMRNLVMLSTEPPRTIAFHAMRIAGKGLTRSILFFLFLGVLDVFYQWWNYRRKMRTTREQLKQEYKEQEGDPHHKAHRKRLHEEIGRQSMLNRVRKADVIVTNPDHIACALRYDPDSEDAPRLLGKGTGYLAEKIKEIAREEDIPVVRDISLAHALYQMEEEDQIPEELFDAVAEVLKWVETVLRAQGEIPAWLAPPAEKVEE
jgi:flagellar biosynthetic protein FlhB